MIPTEMRVSLISSKDLHVSPKDKSGELRHVMSCKDMRLGRPVNERRTADPKDLQSRVASIMPAILSPNHAPFANACISVSVLVLLCWETILGIY